MSDTEAPDEGAPDEVEEEGQPEGDQQDEGTEEEGDEERRPAPKPVDWEKRAHSHAGQAARERSKRQAEQRRNAELEARIEQLERQRGQQDGDELLTLIGHLSDDDEDPIGDIAAVKRALKLFRQREVGDREEQRTQQRANREVETLKTAMLDAEADFALEHPDYTEAANFYRKARAEELADMGYGGDELLAKLSQDLFGLVRTAFANGADPAERVYALAAKRGFKAGGKAADKKLDAFDRAGATGVRPQARPTAAVLSWGDVAKLDGAARDKAFAKLRERERARK